ncbi:MAG TPA: hypothetical protein PLL36_09825, partial [Candidatus Hydrogenedentes bacterium]|nr:hypothetical protein [Candidatus Hydrogenedentota bacterium]
MKTSYVLLGITVLVAGAFCAPSAQAHPYMVGDSWANFGVLAGQAQGIMDAMMTEYVGCNLWSTNCNSQTAIWTSVVGQR